MFHKHDIKRNACQLFGGQAKRGYDWWWHSFTAVGQTTVELYRDGKLIDRIHAENIGCEYGEYDATGPYAKEKP